MPRRIRGLICQLDIEPWGGGIVPHEETRPGPVEDRLRVMRATRANLSCVYGVVPGPCPALAELLDDAMARSPLASMEDEEGVQHRLWRHEADGEAEWMEGQTLMVADGHHRYATALRFREEMRGEHGPGPWDQVMAVVVDAATENPPVLAYHRLLTSGPVPGGGDRVRDLEEVLAELSDDDLVYGLAAWEEAELVHRVARLDGSPPTVCALHRDVLSGIPEAALGFAQDPVVAEQAVRTRGAVAAYFLPATTAERIREVVERGERLPEKSTFFWPKPRTGLVVRLLE